MTPQTCINTARSVINDSESAFYRQSNIELLKYFNDGLKECVGLSPNHFITTADFLCEENFTEQAITFSESSKFVSVIRIKNGKAVHEMEMNSMSRFHPDWASDEAGPAINWAKFPDDKLRFYIYPKAPVMQVLEVSYIRNPATYAIDETVLQVPEFWESALADYIIYRAESKDDEHVNSGRAVSHFNAFVQKITGITQQGQG